MKITPVTACCSKCLWMGLTAENGLVLPDHYDMPLLLSTQDFIPPEELAKVLAKSGSETAKQQAAQLEAQQRIQADNVGHRMLQVWATPPSCFPLPVTCASAVGHGAGLRLRGCMESALHGVLANALHKLAQVLQLIGRLVVRTDAQACADLLHASICGRRRREVRSCLLQAMGWKEGQGLGANKDGIAAPISAASGPKQATDKGGLGAVVGVSLSWLCRIPVQAAGVCASTVFAGILPCKSRR